MLAISLICYLDAELVDRTDCQALLGVDPGSAPGLAACGELGLQRSEGVPDRQRPALQAGPSQRAHGWAPSPAAEDTGFPRVQGAPCQTPARTCGCCRCCSGRGALREALGPREGPEAARAAGAGVGRDTGGGPLRAEVSACPAGPVPGDEDAHGAWVRVRGRAGQGRSLRTGEAGRRRPHWP